MEGMTDGNQPEMFGGHRTETVLTGMRPTGDLHIGHYAGALGLYKEMQERGYDCNFLIADYQAFADYSKDIGRIRRSVFTIALDWMAIGLDPERSNFIIQSYIPEHAELAMLLSMITPYADVQRNPTVAHEIETRGEANISTGFSYYPVSQAADILLHKGTLVPTGDDQLPLTELTRRVARKFNNMYGRVFPIPKELTGNVSRLVGLDGKAKMSKSMSNALFLSDTKEEATQKIMKMYTDPNRKHPTDPGTVEGNPLFIYLRAFDQNLEEIEEFETKYRLGKIGDVVIKKRLAEIMNEFLDPIRERRSLLLENPTLVRDALMDGTNRARPKAQDTMLQVKDAMNISHYEDYNG